MKRLLVVVAVIVSIAGPAFAYRDKKLRQAVAKAAGQMQKHHPEEAVATVQKVAAKLGSGEAYLALGRIQQQAAMMDEAVASFAKARELERSDAEVLTALAGITLSTGSAADALAPAEKAVAISASPEALATLARAHMRANALEKAKEAAEKALAAGATSATAHLAQGEIDLATGRSAEAIAAFRRALELDPQLIEARVGLAAALGAAGQPAEGLAEARRAASEDATSGEAAALSGLLMLAGHAGDAKLWGEAAETAEDGHFRNPYSAVVQYLNGRVFDARPFPERAAERYKRALEIDPKLLPARLALANFHLRQADVATTLSMAQALVADAPWSGEAQLLLGRELLRRKNVSQALGALEKAAALAPGIAEAHALLATAAFFSGKTDVAVEEYAKALALRPDELQWRADYGLFLGRSGDYETAAAELQKVVSSPGYKEAAAFVNLGWVYRNTRPPKIDESIRAYQRALEIDPKQAQATLGLGWTYFTASRYDESIAAYTTTAGLDPALADEAYDGIAWNYYFKGDMAKAREFGAKTKAAGRDDVLLVQNIERFQQKKAMDKDADDKLKEALRQSARCEGIDARLHSKDPGVRAPAVNELRVSGCSGILELLTWTLVNDDSYTVRQATATALGKIGPPAREAARYLKQCTAPCDVRVYPTPEELQQEMACADMRQACLRALAKIGE